ARSLPTPSLPGALPICDPRPLGRYAAAVKLDPELVIAQVLLARAMAVDGDHRRAAELAKEFRIRYPTRTEGAALAVLAWTRDPRSEEHTSELQSRENLV